MNLPKFSGPGSTPSRRRFWNTVAETVISSQKKSGHNVTASEYEGQGTLIDIDRNRGTSGDCCNRDVTEISTMTITGDFIMTVVGFETDSCSFSVTWTRIPHADSFDPDLRQFKLYFGELPTCQLFSEFSQPDFVAPTGTCDSCGVADCILGSTQLEELMVSGSNLLLKFRSDTSETALSQGCSVESDEIAIPFTSCDVSALLGTYTISNHCDDIFDPYEVIFDMTASIIFA